MYLSARQATQVFRIMEELTHGYACNEVRERIGHRLLSLLNADYYASYVWDEESGQYADRVAINMSDDNLANYEKHFQFCDPITPALARRRSATPVSQVMAHDRLAQTEFFNDFLARDGLCYGLNFYAYNHGRNLGDIRIWRSSRRGDFDQRDADMLNAVGPSFANALCMAQPKALTRATHLVEQAIAQCGLSRREAEVISLLLSGQSDADIVERMAIALPTVRSHVQSIFRKSGVSRRSELMSRFLA